MQVAFLSALAVPPGETPDQIYKDNLNLPNWVLSVVGQFCLGEPEAPAHPHCLSWRTIGQDGIGMHPGAGRIRPCSPATFPLRKDLVARLRADATISLLSSLFVLFCWLKPAAPFNSTQICVRSLVSTSA